MSTSNNNDLLLDLILDLRNEARINKDYKTSDSIRDKLSKISKGLELDKKLTLEEEKIKLRNEK